MRVRVLLTLALGLVIAPPIPARAQDTETLRREIEQTHLLWSGLAWPLRRRGTLMEESS